MHPLRSVFPRGASESEGHAEQDETLSPSRFSLNVPAQGEELKTLESMKMTSSQEIAADPRRARS